MTRTEHPPEAIEIVCTPNLLTGTWILDALVDADLIVWKEDMMEEMIEWSPNYRLHRFQTVWERVHG